PHGRSRPGAAVRRALAAAAALATVAAVPALGATTTAPRAAAAPRGEGATPLAPPAGGGGEVAGGMGSTMLRLGIGLLVVVGLILAVWWGMKRMQRGRMPAAGGPAGTLVDVVSTTPLGPTRFLHLIRVGDELILVGATDHAVTPVARIGGEEALGMLGGEMSAEDLRAAFTAAPGAGAAARARAARTAGDTPLVDRLRAMTARRQ
ncbi:MAG TPA: flagellar biosynthetic protein FliO, partial [Miltoncostaeaceae bacterium]|nr:flagellar biosynthetic protein FliO [Miltoncostaeaceae bacterium]